MIMHATISVQRVFSMILLQGGHRVAAAYQDEPDGRGLRQ
jgi:hypothetical protein